MNVFKKLLFCYSCVAFSLLNGASSYSAADSDLQFYRDVASIYLKNPRNFGGFTLPNEQHIVKYYFSIKAVADEQEKRKLIMIFQNVLTHDLKIICDNTIKVQGPEINTTIGKILDNDSENSLNISGEMQSVNLFTTVIKALDKMIFIPLDAN